ncbi:hypothetical protein [Clostridium beijerinckii]|uniref:hypothetical protein n=1 Tax=Clostridium beijerinckii TaxID=1520 RepID=UPI00156FC498|nr:hypothetical protein [Clostridium beijerinckii]NRT73707.1 hypothetical protein [Clostridium beijerinckii]
MNKEMIIGLKNKLNIMIREGIFKGKFVVLFGANTPGDEVINYLSQNNIEVDAIIDNNPINCGKKLVGVSISLPNNLLSEYKENLLVLICSRYYSEMKVQLEEMGYLLNKHIFKILDMNEDVEYSLEKNIFDKSIESILDGLSIYENIRSKYGEDVFVFLNPVKANGDVYITSMYLRHYVKKNNIKKYILLVIGRACYNVAKLFGISNIDMINQNEMELLVKLHRFLKNSEAKIKVIQPYIMYTNILNNMDGYKKLNFNDFFKYSLFKLGDNMEKELPVNLNDEHRIEKILRENSIIKGKSIIISPYANSLPQISWEFWCKLADKLNQYGYRLFTNTSGESEPIIPYTEPIFFEFCDAISIAEYAGIFIGIRSGLCEILSSARCKKIILYPDKACGFSKVIDVYGIKNMGLSNDVIEIEASDNIESLLVQVFNEI